MLITDREFAPVIGRVAPHPPRGAWAARPSSSTSATASSPAPASASASHEYEALLAAHAPLARLEGPADEWDAIAVSYTSGTTGDPKGVVTHHRGAYLNAVSQRGDLDDAELRRLSLDPADVPLQRLVLSVDDRDARRHPCLPPQGRGGGDLRGDPRPQGRPLLRRADRPHHADQRARRSCARASTTASAPWSPRPRRRRR